MIRLSNHHYSACCGARDLSDKLINRQTLGSTQTLSGNSSTNIYCSRRKLCGGSPSLGQNGEAKTKLK